MENLTHTTKVIIKSKLPNRVFNSPCIKYANFDDGSYINLIKLITPYANGDSYAVYETTRNPNCSNKLFKTLEDAEKGYKSAITGGELFSFLKNEAVTCNY